MIKTQTVKRKPMIDRRTKGSPLRVYPTLQILQPALREAGFPIGTALEVVSSAGEIVITAVEPTK